MTSVDSFFGSYLKTDDITGETVLTVKEVRVESIGRDDDAKEKPVVYFKEIEKGLALNQVNAAAISEALRTKEIEEWANKKVTLYIDKAVLYKGKRVGGVRVKVPGGGAE